MAHDNYPGSSSSSYEKKELAAAREKIREARKLLNYLDTRWYDYEAHRRQSGIKSEQLGNEIRGLTADLIEALGFIVGHVAPKLSSPDDLFAIATLQQRVDDSITLLEML